MTPFRALPLKPLGTGELLDRALTVYRTQFKELFKLSLCFQIALHALTKVFELVAFAKFPLFVQPRALAEHPSLDALSGQMLWAVPMIFFFVGVSLLLWQLSIAAVTTPPAEAISSVPLRAIEAWRRLKPRMAALVWTITLELFVILFNVALGALPLVFGVLLAFRDPSPVALALLAIGCGLSLFMMLGMFLVALLRYILVPSIVLIEGLSGWRALKRAAAMMRGRSTESFWSYPKIRGSLVMLVLGLATNAVVLVATAPRSLVLMADASANPNAPLLLLVELFEMLANAAIAPFGMIALALFYLDLRVRREAVDLELAAERMAKAA